MLFCYSSTTKDSSSGLNHVCVCGFSGEWGEGSNGEDTKHNCVEIVE